MLSSFAVGMLKHSFYPPGCRGGAGDFRKFSVRGSWEIFGIQGGALKSRGAEDFDESGKNVKETYSKIE